MFEHPRLSRLLLVVEKNGKRRSKARQKRLRNHFSQFFAKVKIVASRAKNRQIFEFFAIVKHRFGKPPLSRELLGIAIARANPKTAFERELNSPSLRFRQIWPKVNGLASRSPEVTEVKKTVFEQNLSPRITFSFLYVRQ